MTDRRSLYKKIINFGDVVPKNPLEVCFGDTVDNKFQSGVLADTHSGQGSRNCQLLLADYCGNTWDGYCEAASYNTSLRYPNQVLGCYSIMPGYDVDSINLPLGQQLIRNAAVKRFCIFPTSVKRCQPFNPTDPKSPLVCFESNDTITSPYENRLYCEIKDFSELDQDPLFNKMLQQPDCCIDIILHIYQKAKNSGKLEDLMKTNFGKFVNNNPQYFVNL